MTRQNIFAALVALGLAIVGSLAGCRTTHLDPDTGRAYRAALDAQSEAASSEDEPPSLSADDAKRVLKVHQYGANSKDSKGSGSSGSGSIATSTSVSPSTYGGGRWQGASGNISLEAK